MDWQAIGQAVIGPGGALALAIFVITSLVRGWLVPGFIYTKTDDKLDRALNGLEAMSTALDRLTDEIRARNGPRGRI